MYLKQRDKAIRLWVDKHGGITIKQCANIFFKNSNNKYDLAGKRLRILYNNKYLKRYKKDMYSEVVYYLDKPYKEHKMKLLDVYSRLFMIGEITNFETSFRFNANKRRELDGLIEIDILEGEYLVSYPIIIEIDMTHDTSLKRMEDIYNSNCMQDKYGVFPTVIIVQRNNWQKKISTDLMNIIYLNWNLDGLEDIFKES